MEVRQTRHQEIKLIKIDEPAANIRFTGRSDSMRASDSDPVWQILLEYRVGDIVTSTYALMGSFTGRWDQRTTYFSSTTPDENSPLSDFQDGIQTTGLRVAGRVTIVALNSSTWTALPTTALSNRNAVAIQNEDTSIKVKVNYSNSVSGFTGMTIFPNGGERQYNISDNIILYAKCESGTVNVTVEELS